MSPEEATKLLHAYVDGELDPARSVELEAHLAENAASRAAYERLLELSAVVRANAEYHSAPASLAAGLRKAIPIAPEAPRRMLRWDSLRPAAALATVALVTWAATFAWLRPGQEDRITQEVLASHVRATLANRLFDVASSDQHTVKPWLSSRLPYSPPVADFSAHGFELIGARLDYVAGQPTAALVYKRRQHVIDVFVRPGEGDAGVGTRDGFNIERFATNGMRFWLVSDLNRNELSDLARLLAEASPAP
jgi:anti-sigma factor RsiW